MTDRAAAARYARALFDVAVKEADPQAVETDLGGFLSVVDSHAALAQVLFSPAVPVPRKQAAVTALVAQVRGFSPVVARLLAIMAERDRLPLLPEVLTAYRARVLDHLKVVRAEITTAVPLPDDRRQALERRLAEATGREVQVEMRVDPAIIGGVVTKIGSTIYDGSVVQQLERMKQQLVEDT